MSFATAKDPPESCSLFRAAEHPSHTSLGALVVTANNFASPRDTQFRRRFRRVCPLAPQLLVVTRILDQTDLTTWLTSSFVLCSNFHHKIIKFLGDGFLQHPIAASPSNTPQPPVPSNFFDKN